MATIEGIVQAIGRDLSPEFERRLRAALSEMGREWLIDQVVHLALVRQGLADLDADSASAAAARAERLARVRRLALDAESVASFAHQHAHTGRDQLVAAGHLLASAPAKGTQLITTEHRTPSGEELLVRAKDVLFALLFGDESTATQLDRVQQELLTLALPRAKVGAVDFMRAATELAVAGTWQDPDSVSNDERADNVLLEIQFAETADELVGRAIIVALSLINNLEINEQVLYARMINVEESTLIS